MVRSVQAARGEPYPQDIVKERTKALKVGQALQTPDFVVALNVDGTEPDWMMTNLTYIPFHRGWAGGFRQLLEKLDSVDAPRPLQDGRAIAISTFIPTDVVSNSPEQLFSNVLPFARIPDHVLRCSVDPPCDSEERLAADGTWPYYFVSPRELLAFR